MTRIRPALHNSALRGETCNLEQKAALAQKYGYVGLDFSIADIRDHAGGDPSAVKATLARHGVEPNVVTGVLSSQLFAADAEWEPTVGQIKERARLAAAVGGSRSTAVFWNRVHQSTKEVRQQTLRRLRQIDKELADTGIRMGVKYLGVRSLYPERPYAFIQSLAEARQLFAEAQVQHFGWTIDSYHWYAAGDNIDAIRQLTNPPIVALHLNDARDLPLAQLDDKDRLMPGDGVIPLTGLVDAAVAAGFNGFVALEVMGPSVAGMDADACAREGMQAMRRLWPDMGAS